MTNVLLGLIFVALLFVVNSIDCIGNKLDHLVWPELFEDELYMQQRKIKGTYK